MEFLQKNNEDSRTISNFCRLNGLAETKSYPMKSMRVVLNWLGRKQIFSVLDVKKGLFQIDRRSYTTKWTTIRTALGLSQ